MVWMKVPMTAKRKHVNQKMKIKVRQMSLWMDGEVDMETETETETTDTETDEDVTASTKVLLEPLIPIHNSSKGYYSFLIKLNKHTVYHCIVAGTSATKVFTVLNDMAMTCVSLTTFFKYQQVSLKSTLCFSFC